MTRVAMYCCRCLLFFLLVMISWSVSSAQDSLRHVLHYATEPADRAHAAVLLAETMMPARMDSAFVLLQQGSAVLDGDDLLRQADYYNILGNYYWFSNQPDQAIQQFKQTLALPFAIKPDQHFAIATNSIGVLFSQTGNSDSARVYLNRSLELDRARDNMHGVTKNMYDLALLHYRQDQFELALNHLQQVVAFQISVQDSFRLIHTKSLMGSIYVKLDSTDKAIQQFTASAHLADLTGNALAVAYAYNNLAAIYCVQPEGLEKTLHFARNGLKIAKQMKDFPALMNLNVNIGEAYLFLGDLDQALDYFLIAYQYYDDVRSPRMQSDLLIRMGNLYLKLSENTFARKHLEKGLETAKLVGALDKQSKAYFYLASLDSLEGGFRDAFLNHQKGVQLRDSIFNKETNSRIAELQIIYETEQQARKISELEHQDRIFRIRQQVGLAGTLLIVLILILVIRYLQKRRIVSQQRLIIQQQEKEKIEAELNVNRRELTGKVLSLVKSDELITQLKSDLQKLLPKADTNTSHELRSALRLLNSNAKNQALWDEFEQRFDELNNGFISKLVKRYPDLTPGEIRMCAMLRLQLTSKEIAELSKRSFRTIEYVRSNIRKKMGLPAGDNLTRHILNI